MADRDPRPALVVCRNLGGLPWLKRVAGEVRGRLIVASDDLRVHAAARRMPAVGETVYLEKIEASFAVASDVLALLQEVNDWLVRAGRDTDLPADLLYWICHCEGGDTTQRIQDALILVRSYIELIARHRPSEIVVIRSGAASWEDDLVLECARDAQVPVRTVGGGWRVGLNWLWEEWRPLAKEVYLALSTVRAKLGALARRAPPIDPARAVVVQLCTSAAKHVNQCLPLVRALDRAGLQGIALCWEAAAAARDIRAEGHTAVVLESWVTTSVLLGSWLRTARSWYRLRRRMDGFLNGARVCEHQHLVRPVLARSMRAFFVAEVAHRYRLFRAAERFFAANPPRAARLWTRVLAEGVTTYRALQRHCRPLLFWQPGWDYMVPWPYARYDVPADLIVAVSDTHRKMLLERGVPESEVIVGGIQWTARISAFKEQYNRDASRRVLGLPEDAELYALVDSSYPARGSLAPAEQVLMLTAMFDLAKAHPKLHLIVKMHPGHKPGILETLLADFGLKNVTCVPPHELPYHALMAADLVVTKMSTLALEGMFVGVPTIGVLLDRELRFACYEDAADYVFDIEALKARVVELLKDRDFRAEWTARLRRNATAYLERHGFARNEDPNRTVVSVLREKYLISQPV